MELHEVKKNLEVVAYGNGIDIMDKYVIKETALAAVVLADIQIRLHGYIENIEKMYEGVYTSFTKEMILDMLKIFKYEGGTGNDTANGIHNNV